MTSRSPSVSGRNEYSIASLRHQLSNREALAPSVHAVLDAFLAKMTRLQLRQHKRSSGLEREYMKLCYGIEQAPDRKLLLTLQTQATRMKNRYKDVVPFEKTRVKLQHTVDDYINANYIEGGYIACCAPVPAAIRDFWHMVWQCDVHVVLMLTKLVEQERVKADRYWPICFEKTMDVDGVRVRLLDTDQGSIRSEGVIVRRFQVSQVNDQGQEGANRVVQHLQLTTWPDHGVLRDFKVIAMILDAVNIYRREASRTHGVDARVVVHCSAGIGRSGTFIAIDILMQQLYRVLTDSSNSVDQMVRAMQQAVDIPRVVSHLRSQRPGMVQTPEQYEMIYEYLAAVVSGNRPW